MYKCLYIHWAIEKFSPEKVFKYIHDVSEADELNKNLKTHIEYKH